MPRASPRQERSTQKYENDETNWNEVNKSISRLNYILQKPHRVNSSADTVFDNYVSQSGLLSSDELDCIIRDLSKVFDISAPSDRSALQIYQTLLEDSVFIGINKKSFQSFYRNLLLWLKFLFASKLEAHSPLNTNILYSGGLISLDPAKGQKIEDYLEIKQQLGEGAFGQVHLASDKTRYGRIVVVKQIKIAGKISKTALIIEMETLKQADHPNIVSIFQVYISRSDVYIVMERLEGGELTNFIPAIPYLPLSSQANKGRRASPYEEQMICVLVKQILEGISYCHTNGIMHRDLKPANIMIANTPGVRGEVPIVKIVDFGLAYNEGMKNDNIMTAAGTPLYQGPESDVHRRSSTKGDIWAIGILTYQLFTGIHPFDLHRDVHFDKRGIPLGDGAEQYNARIRFKAFKSLLHDKNYIPPQMNIPDTPYSLILRMLDRDENRRLGARSCLSHRWFLLGSPHDLPISRVKMFIERLEHFSMMNILQVAILNMVAHHITFKAADAIQLFKHIDRNNDGVISIPELREFLTNYNVSPSKQQRIVQLMDVDKSTCISCREFIAAVHEFDKSHEVHLRIVFRELDTDGDSLLCADDFRPLFREIESDTLVKMMSFIDTNHSNSICWKEFRDFVYARN